MKKPIKVFWSELGQRFYASAHYKQEGNHVTITGEKFDVTDDIVAAVIKHEIVFSAGEVMAPKKPKTCEA